MPEVICDTSALQYLYQIDQLDLLPLLYTQVNIPQAVVDELAQGRDLGIALPNPLGLDWICIHPVPAEILIPGWPNLGAGERAVLSLARTMPHPLVIVDDGLARRYAQQFNLPFTGTLGILLKAKQKGDVKAILPLLDQLTSLRFRLAPETRLAVLKLANELD